MVWNYCWSIIVTLTEIETSVSITPEAYFTVSEFEEELCKYKMILTAQISIKIFQKTTRNIFTRPSDFNIMTAYLIVK